MPRVEVQRIHAALESLINMADEQAAMAEARSDPRQRVAAVMAQRVLMEVVTSSRELLNLAEAEGRIDADGYADFPAETLRSVEQVEAMQRAQRGRALVS